MEKKKKCHHTEKAKESLQARLLFIWGYGNGSKGEINCQSLFPGFTVISTTLFGTSWPPYGPPKTSPDTSR
jgi:hypothetical protein